MDRSRLGALSDDQLLRGLADLLTRSRGNEADLVAHIGEVDARRLYAREACPSMFAYCTEVLHLSEAEAYLRITAARASREHPEILERLRDGRIHLSGLARLAPHLTRGNAATLLERAAHRSKREILELVAEIAPRPDVAATVRRLPRAAAPATPVACAASPASPASVASPAFLASAASAPAVGSAEAIQPADRQLCPDRAGPSRTPTGPALEPLSPGRYKVQFTADAALQAKLERLQHLLRARLPEAGLAAVIDLAVTETLERLEGRRWGRGKPARQAVDAQAPRVAQAGRDAARPAASTTGSRHPSRHIPAAVRKMVHDRDGGRCRYRSDNGRRCSERVLLEIHHRHPYGFGGDGRPTNLGLLCRQHNRFLAEHDYGAEAMQRRRGPVGARAAAALPP